jgi:hypothetical protein
MALYSEGRGSSAQIEYDIRGVLKSGKNSYGVKGETLLKYVDGGELFIKECRVVLFNGDNVHKRYHTLFKVDRDILYMVDYNRKVIYRYDEFFKVAYLTYGCGIFFDIKDIDLNITIKRIEFNKKFKKREFELPKYPVEISTKRD